MNTQETLRQIKICEDSGATRRAAILRARLDGNKEEEIKITTANLFKDPNLVKKEDSAKYKALAAKMGDENRPSPSALYQMKEDGMSWTEISRAANVRQPWLTVKKFCLDNGMDYSKLK